MRKGEKVIGIFSMVLSSLLSTFLPLCSLFHPIIRAFRPSSNLDPIFSRMANLSLLSLSSFLQTRSENRKKPLLRNERKRSDKDGKGKRY